MKLCDYGCSQEAKYKFKNGKWCCSEHTNKCPKQREARIGENNPFFGKRHTEKTKEKQREWHKKNQSGESNHMFGRKHTKETRKLMREAHLEMKKPWTSENMKKRTGENNPMFGKHHTKKTRKKMSNALKGEKNHMWNPDREQRFAPYTEKLYDKDYRKQILLEQKHICPICNKKLKDRKELHHIDSNKQNDEKENLVFLHSKCHNKTKGRNRNYWKRKLEKV